MEKAKIMRRSLALLLALFMCISLLPGLGMRASALADTSIQIAQKTLTDADGAELPLTAGQFSFTLTPLFPTQDGNDGYYTLGYADDVLTVTNGADGKISVDRSAFTQTLHDRYCYDDSNAGNIFNGAYAFLMQEVDAGAAGYNYDANAYVISVVFGTGTLLDVAAMQYTEDASGHYRFTSDVDALYSANGFLTGENTVEGYVPFLNTFSASVTLTFTVDDAAHGSLVTDTEGEVTPLKVVTRTAGSAVEFLPVPAPADGYAFTGWTFDKDPHPGTYYQHDNLSPLLTWILTEDTIVTAHFQPIPEKYTITYKQPEDAGYAGEPYTTAPVAGGTELILINRDLAEIFSESTWVQPNDAAFLGWRDDMGTPDPVDDRFLTADQVLTLNTDKTLTAVYSGCVTLTFKVSDPAAGDLVTAANGVVDSYSELHLAGTAIGQLPVPVPASGYQFIGWTSTADPGKIYTHSTATQLTALAVAADTTVTALFEPIQYTLTFESNGGSEVSPILLSAGSTVVLTQITTKNDYTFEGWYADAALTEKVTSVTLNDNTTVYAKWTKNSAGTIDWNKTDHYAYIIGYDDGLVHPDANITRGETATIFFRLMTDASRNTWWKTTNTFSDVTADRWYNNAVSTLENAHFVDGYGNGTFGANRPITRAEFAVIAARAGGADGKYAGADQFSDISGHWAEGYINEAAEMGLIDGYADGTFNPDAYITRAEAITLVNRFLGRDRVDAASLLPGMIVWPDNAATSAWYYPAVQEATNSHNFTRRSDNTETWTRITAVRDWAALEAAWSTANSGK